MPRRAREPSVTGYMHIIVKGNGGQILFEEPQDFRFFLTKMKYSCYDTGVKLCAYCLMDNHVHLLTYSDINNLSLFMKKLCVSYSEYFNKKHKRTGHLFQDRFKSEPINNEEYLLTAFRYILLNPQKAGICKASEYKWSSYMLYDFPPNFMELDLLYNLIGKKKEYEEYISSDNNDECMEFSSEKHTDDWAITEIRKWLGINSGTEIQNFEKKKRNSAIHTLKVHGLSIRQIERLTGINRNVIQRA